MSKNPWEPRGSKIESRRDFARFGQFGKVLDQLGLTLADFNTTSGKNKVYTPRAPLMLRHTDDSQSKWVTEYVIHSFTEGIVECTFKTYWQEGPRSRKVIVKTNDPSPDPASFILFTVLPMIGRGLIGRGGLKVTELAHWSIDAKGWKVVRG